MADTIPKESVERLEMERAERGGEEHAQAPENPVFELV
jgi:hypothetical protein